MFVPPLSQILQNVNPDTITFFLSHPECIPNSYISANDFANEVSLLRSRICCKCYDEEKLLTFKPTQFQSLKEMSRCLLKVIQLYSHFTATLL